MSNIRKAESIDLASLLEIDLSISPHLKRPDYLKQAIHKKECYIYESNQQASAYLIFNYQFFEQGFVSLIVVHKEYQNAGIATKLLHFAEKSCETDKIFSSTNKSNTRMRSLFEKLGYAESGIIENLDEGDPEIIYFKKLNKV